ncbi:MAG TPA: GFA family protein [Bdellovibrio sp.]
MKYSGSCHCGAVKFEVEGNFQEGMTCNCSMCGRKGTVLTFAPEASFTLLSGADKLTDYQFGKKNIHHTFCKVCGVTSFATGNMPNGDVMKAINLRCLENFPLESIKMNHVNGKDF